MYIINIGLNVGSQEPARQLRKTIKLIQPRQFTIQSGTWQGVTERTLIAEISREKFRELERICNELQQDAISYKAGRKTGLIFNTGYTGEKYQFNETLFNNL